MPEKSSGKGNNSLKQWLGALGFLAGMALFGFVILYLMNAPGNNHFNRQDITAAEYEYHSYPTGMAGHVEFMKYTDGRTYVGDYSWLGGDKGGFTEYWDWDGDGQVDAIYEHGSGTTYSRMKTILDRNTDFQTHREEFLAADKLKKELEEKYRKK